MNNHTNSTDHEMVNGKAENMSLLPAESSANRLAVNGGGAYEAGTRSVVSRVAGPYEEETEINFHQLLGMFLRRWKVMLAAFLVVVTVAVVFTWTATPIYEAKSTVQVDTSKSARFSGMEDMPFLSEMTGFNQSHSQENEVEIIKSSVVQDPALKRLTPEQQKDVEPYPVTVSPIRSTDLLVIAARSHNPEAAAARANAIAAAYLDRSLNKARGQVSSAADYVEVQKKDMRKNLDKARLALQQFKEKNGTVDLSAEAAAKIQQLSAVESNLKQTQADYAANVAQVQALKGMADKMSPTTKKPSGYVVSPEVAALKDRLSTLEADKVNALTDYQPGSRKIREIQEQIDAVKGQLVGKAQFTVQAYSNETNPVRLSLDQSIAQTQGSVWALEARSKALKELSERTRQELTRLPAQESRLSQLQSDLETYQQAYQSLGDKYQTLKISENARRANAEVLSPAPVPHSPVSPRKIRNLLAAIAFGALLAFMLAALLERLDDRVHSEDEVIQATQLPILAHIPLIEETQRRDVLVSQKNGNPLLREGFRMLRTNISFLALDAPIRSLVMTSTQPGEGKSLSSVNLAITAAQGGESVILVDCDLRRPTIHHLLEISNKVGFTSVVSGSCSLEDALQETKIPNLRVLTSGPVPPDTFALLKSRAGQACLKQVFESADFVVVDTPPALVMADAQLVASIADAVLLVVSSKEATKRDINRTRDLLVQTGASLLGIVFNKASDGVGGYYDYYKYRYYSHYFKEGEDEDEGKDEKPALTGKTKK